MREATKEEMQFVFDEVCKHLLKQGPSLAAGSLCAYRGEKGKMCAAGFLISDEYYDPSLEGKSSRNRKVMGAIKKSLGFTLPVQFVRSLQNCHDDHWRYSGATYWESSFYRELKIVARFNGLEVPECLN